MNSATLCNSLKMEYLEDLFLAVERGSLESVKHLVEEQEADINAKREGDRHTKGTPLYYAAKIGHTPVVRYLIEKGSALDETDGNGCTALSAAAESGHVEICRMIIANGATVNAVSNDGETPLSEASKSGSFEIVKMLLEKDASFVNHKTCHRRTPLMEACKGGYGEICRILLKSGAMLNESDIHGETALLEAAKLGREDIVALLLDSGDGCLSLDHKNNNGWSALMLACKGGREKVCRLLLEKGVKVTQSSERDRDKTPLIYAAESGNEAIVSMLLEKDISALNQADHNGDTALSAACSSGYAKVCQILIEKGASINTVRYGGRTPLIIAALRGRLEICKILLDGKQHADLEHQDEDGDTALTAVCRIVNNVAEADRTAICKLLIDRGANVLACTNTLSSILTVATVAGLEDIVRMLLERDATNLEQKNWLQRTAFIEACIQGHVNICKVLIEKGANINAEDDSGRTPLINAASSRNEAIVKILLDTCNASLNHQDNKNGETALMAACSRVVFSTTVEPSRFSICKMLVDHGADVNICNYNGSTALAYAKTLGSIEIVDLLLEKADMAVVDGGGRTLLMRAIQSRDLQFSKRLINKGVNVDAVDNEGNTALIYAANGPHDLIEMLLEIPSLKTINHRNKEDVSALISIYQNFGRLYHLNPAAFRSICLQMLRAGAFFHLDPFEVDLGFQRTWRDPSIFVPFLDITLELRRKNSLIVGTFLKKYLNQAGRRSLRVLCQLFPRSLQAISRTVILSRLPTGLQGRHDAINRLNLPKCLEIILRYGD